MKYPIYLNYVQLGLAAIAALTFVDIALLLPALVALAIGIIFMISHDRMRIAGGIVAIIFSLISMLGTIGNISTKDGSTSFGISPEVGAGLAVASLLAVPAFHIVGNRGTLSQPAWISGIVAIDLAAILGILYGGSLGNQAALFSYVVAVLCLIPIWATFELGRKTA